MDQTLLYGVVLASILAAISWVDWRQQIIPDALNLTLAGTGLAYQLVIAPHLLWIQVGTGIAVFSIFWTLRRAHAWRSGRIGLGLGDVKMAGAAAIWLNPWSFPCFVFLASLGALAFIGGRQLVQRDVRYATRVPFGPFLAASLLVIWLVDRQLKDLMGSSI